MCECLTFLQPSDAIVIVCSDLNFPSINLNGDKSMLLNDSSCTGLFLKYFYDNDMFQFVDEPIRGLVIFLILYYVMITMLSVILRPLIPSVLVIIAWLALVSSVVPCLTILQLLITISIELIGIV